MSAVLNLKQLVNAGLVFLMLLLQLLYFMYHVFQDLVQLLKSVVDRDVQSVTLLSDAVEQLLNFSLY